MFDASSQDPCGALDFQQNACVPPTEWCGPCAFHPSSWQGTAHPPSPNVQGITRALLVAGNNIGAEASKQCALAMLPYRNDDGTWVYNTALAEILYEGQIGWHNAIRRSQHPASACQHCLHQSISRANIRPLAT